MTEFDHIAEIVALLGGRAAGPNWQIGSGDDAALFTGGPFPLVCVDTMVEGVHWDDRFSLPADVGFKLLASNLSDVAAMGGRPGPFLLALSIGPGRDPGFVTSLALGIDDARRAHGLDVQTCVALGGDLTRSPATTVVSLTLFGRLESKVWRRDGAVPGDQIWVSGPLGDAAAGLALLKHETPSRSEFDSLHGRHRRPVARTDLVPLLSRTDISSAIDVSDGLTGDLQHILDESKVGAEVCIDRVPHSPELKTAARELGVDRLRWILAGGDDYQLLLTAPVAAAEVLTAVGCHRVGRIVEGVSMSWNGSSKDVATAQSLTGYRH